MLHELIVFRIMKGWLAKVKRGEESAEPEEQLATIEHKLRRVTQIFESVYVRALFQRRARRWP